MHADNNAIKTAKQEEKTKSKIIKNKTKKHRQSTKTENLEQKHNLKMQSKKPKAQKPNLNPIKT